MIRSIMLAALLVTLSGVANADRGDDNDGGGRWRDRDEGPRFAAPEIDPSSAIAGLTLLAGGLVVLRGRRQG